MALHHIYADVVLLTDKEIEKYRALRGRHSTLNSRAFHSMVYCEGLRVMHNLAERVKEEHRDQT